jgi:iron(III) transport system permease protein
MTDITTIPAAPRAPLAARLGASPAQIAAIALVALFLLAFLVVPIVRVIQIAFTGPEGGFSLIHFGDFFQTSLLRESFWNSVYAASMTVVVASLIAVPLATIISRFQFRGAALIHTLGVIPLVMPPFVGAVAMQLIYGKNGSINLLLHDWFGFRIPFMEGLNGVIFVEAVHYFPFILLNLSAALSNIDSAMEESAQNLGASGFSLFRKIVFPLALPGYVAGAALVFVKVFDDLATPLLLSVTNMLAPQAICASHRSALPIRRAT